MKFNRGYPDSPSFRETSFGFNVGARPARLAGALRSRRWPRCRAAPFRLLVLVARAADRAQSVFRSRSGARAVCFGFRLQLVFILF